MVKIKAIWKFSAALLAFLMLAFVVLPHHHHHDVGHSICFDRHGDHHDHQHTAQDQSSCPIEAPCDECPMEFDELIAEAVSHTHTSKCSVSDCHCDPHFQLVKFTPDFLGWVLDRGGIALPCFAESQFSYERLVVDHTHTAILLGLGLRAPPVA